MKLVKNIFAVCLIFIFLWMLIVTASPIKIGGLREKYNICDINNVVSWIPTQAKLSYIKSEKLLGSNSYIELMYPAQPERPLIICKRHIPVLYVYQAKTINVKIKLNQSGEFHVGLATGGIGPSWSALVKPEDVNKEILLTWSLDREQSSKSLKLNWLPGDFSGGGIFVEKTDHNKDLVITIYEMYLQ